MSERETRREDKRGEARRLEERRVIYIESKSAVLLQYIYVRICLRISKFKRRFTPIQNIPRSS